MPQVHVIEHTRSISIPTECYSDLSAEVSLALLTAFGDVATAALLKEFIHRLSILQDKSKSDHTEKKATHEKPTVHSLQHQGLMQTTKALKKTVHEFRHAHGAEKKKLKVCVYVLYMCMYVCVRVCLCV